MAPAIIIVDEAHHFQANMYQEVSKQYASPRTVIMGYTATPLRLDGQLFSDHFDVLVKSLEVREFISRGYLSGFRHFATAEPDIKSIRIDPLTRDFDQGALADVMSGDRIMADVVAGYKKHGQSGKAIVFCVNKRHCDVVSQRFADEGYRSEVINSDTAMKEREMILDRFRSGQTRILCNVDIFSEGFDCPDIDCVILARPTQSLTLYMQQIGRALRVNPEHPDRVAIILDNAKNWERFGLVSQERKWTLDHEPKVKPVIRLEKSQSGEIAETTLPAETRHKGLAEVMDGSTIDVDLITGEKSIKLYVPVSEFESSDAPGNFKLDQVAGGDEIGQLSGPCQLRTKHFQFNLNIQSSLYRTLGLNGNLTPVKFQGKVHNTRYERIGRNYKLQEKLPRMNCVEELFFLLMKNLFLEVRKKSIQPGIGRDFNFSIGNLSSNNDVKIMLDLNEVKNKNLKFGLWRKQVFSRQPGRTLVSELRAMQVIFDLLVK